MYASNDNDSVPISFVIYALLVQGYWIYGISAVFFCQGTCRDGRLKYVDLKLRFDEAGSYTTDKFVDFKMTNSGY